MKQYKIIKGLRTDAALQTTQKNTLPSYYAEQGAIDHTYKKLAHMGFRGSNIFGAALGAKNCFFVLLNSANSPGSALWNRPRPAIL